MDHSLFNSLIDISDTPAARRGQADLMLERARWAATVFDRFDRASTMKIVDAVANEAHEMAGEFAQKIVAEAGFGVVEHKRIKNELTARPLVDFYRDQDFINARIDESRKIVEIPRPAGIIFALTPSTNPIATLNFKVLLALMTRNAIVISPHPAVRIASAEAANRLMQAAADAGAPKGIIQILETPTIPLVDAFMSSDKTNVILATGGTAMVRAAYSSSNPAIGVGPGNAPVYVDSSADIAKAAEHIVASKSFDNSVLCTNESTLITLPEVANPLKSAMKSEGAYFCSEDEVERLRRFLFSPRGFNVEAVGRDAKWIAEECGFRVPSNTKILVTPISQIGVEERLSKEKLCPILAFHIAKTKTQAFSQARAVLRLTGAGHSAAIHAKDESTIMAYASLVEVYRVIVNAPCSQGAAGFATNLAPTFTIGTGFFGRSSIGENIGPQHLVHWTRVAYNSNHNVAFGNFDNLNRAFSGPLPAAPADGVPGSIKSNLSPNGNSHSAMSSLDTSTKVELRRLIAEELRSLLGK